MHTHKRYLVLITIFSRDLRSTSYALEPVLLSQRKVLVCFLEMPHNYLLCAYTTNSTAYIIS
jgi:hypothetical protein